MQFLNEMYVRLSNVRDESGQGMAEYGLILALIAVICMGAFQLLGGNINTAIGSVAGAF